MIPSQKLVNIPACLVASMLLAGCQMLPSAPAVDPERACIDAATALRQGAEDRDPLTRTHALEAICQTLGAKAGGVFKQALSDEYPPVRFAAAMGIGDLGYAPAKPVLLAMAQSKTQTAPTEEPEPDKRVFCAVIYALHRLGDDAYTSELGSMLFDQEKEVRASAAMVMGKMGEPSGITPLRIRLEEEHDPSVQLQIVESLATLGDQGAVVLMEAYTKTQFLEDRLVAISAMERVNSPRAGRVLRSMMADAQPMRVRVAAAGALARLGQADEQAYRLALRAATDPAGMLQRASKGREESSEMTVHSLQRLAAISLGWMKRPEAVNVLHKLLASKDGAVRAAAALSILRLLESYQPVQPVVEPDVAQTQAAASRPEAQRPLQELHTAGAKD